MANKAKISPKRGGYTYYFISIIGLLLFAFNPFNLTDFGMWILGTLSMSSALLGYTCSPSNQYHFCLVSITLSFIASIIVINLINEPIIKLSTYWQVVFLGLTIAFYLRANGLFSSEYSMKKTLSLSRLIASFMGILLGSCLYIYGEIMIK